MRRPHAALIAGALATRLALATAAAAPPAPGPAAATEPARLATAYDAAFAALTRGDLDAAIAAFDDVALRTTDPERRAAARELGRLARELRARRVRLVTGAAAPGASPTGRGVPEDDRPGAGRIEVVAASTLVGFYAGFVAIDVAEIDDFRIGTLVVTATTAAGFVGSFFGSRGRDVSGGMAAAYSTGLLVGGGNGFLLASPLGFTDDEEGFLTLGLAGMALGGVGGLVLGDRVRPTRAQADLSFTTAWMGLSTVGLGLVLAAPDLETDTVLLLLAGGLDVGAGAGLGVGRQLDWSKGRGRLVMLAAFLGALAGFGASAVVVGTPDGETEGRLMAGGVLAGLWGGFTLGATLTRGMEPDPRFAADDGGLGVALAPVVIDGRPGLGLAGAF